MALTWRQQRFYLSRLKVYRAVDAVDGTTRRRTDATFAVVTGLAAVPCLYFYTQNDSDPAGIARIKRRTALTEDAVKVEASIDIRDGDYVVDVTPGSANYGTVHRVQGEPRIRPSFGGRQTNERVLQLMTDPEAPAEVVP